jgi:hypothetical protein
MQRVRSLSLLLLAAACAPSVPALLERGSLRAQHDDWRAARDSYDTAAARKDATVTERAQAWLGAARACERLEDEAGARARLERAVAADVPGVTEPALFYLAELVRPSDRARALNLYYRAAAGAEKHGGGFPYKEAMDRIVQMSLTSP